jgi:hypothetical protein
MAKKNDRSRLWPGGFVHDSFQEVNRFSLAIESNWSLSLCR